LSFFVFHCFQCDHFLVPIFVVWVRVVDEKGADVGDVDRIRPAPDDVAALRDAVIGKWRNQLPGLDANQLKVYPIGTDLSSGKPPAGVEPMRRSAAVTEGTDEDHPLVVSVPGMQILLLFVLFHSHI
jgi:hypothetical protein